jgi:hypothetical protein
MLVLSAAPMPDSRRFRPGSANTISGVGSPVRLAAIDCRMASFSVTVGLMVARSGGGARVTWEGARVGIGVGGEGFVEGYAMLEAILSDIGAAVPPVVLTSTQFGYPLNPIAQAEQLGPLYPRAHLQEQPDILYPETLSARAEQSEVFEHGIGAHKG